MYIADPCYRVGLLSPKGEQINYACGLSVLLTSARAVLAAVSHTEKAYKLQENLIR
jgi:hypothetical protein